ERGFAREVFHPQVGWVTRAGPTVRMANQAPAPVGFSHVAGEDNETVLGEILGLSAEEIRDLTERQVLR
ncbi:MAG TPA: CoA transferase, partial [Candidatus Binatia bacterium]|nr:CoA transferase [Candidatus Binatia bacterium]